MTALVTILTNERDFAADLVINNLHALGVEVRRLNVEAAMSSPALPWQPDGARQLGAVWWRQFELDERPADLAGVDELLVRRAQWRGWLSTVDLPGSAWMNNLWAARRAENKIVQLQVARQLGFAVPETVVTNDRDQALAFNDANGPTVVKTVSSAYFAFSDQSFVFTESLENEALADKHLWHRAPVVVQQRITDGLDARVISFGDRTFGAVLRSEGLDWRKSSGSANRWNEWAVPPALVDLCHRYRSHLGLEYAAFDFMVADQPWFLEANQAGEFAFIDRHLSLGIAESLAERLRELGER